MTVALVMLDAQHNMLLGDPPVVGVAEVRPVLERLLKAARAANAPVVQVQNDGPEGYPDEPNTPGWALVFDVRDGEVVRRKIASDVFVDHPDLAGWLRSQGVDRLVIAGMQSEFCVLSTALGAVRLGFGVVVPQGGHATYDDGATSAADLVVKVEQELVAAGVEVLPASAVRFG